ncbi:VanZ family protein [Azospirillum sp. ST 5-10]|uniref:VanZ family protein n=1 Tax=unclassified Azospirillum TaxID=2630922 RepID=UPI003F49DB8F
MSGAALPALGTLRRGARRLLLPLSALVLVGAALPQLAPPSAHGVDKLVHAAAFAVLGVGMTVGSVGRRQTVAGWASLVLLAVAIEAVQSVVPGRSPSLTDAAASVLGAAAGAGTGLWLLHHHRRLERRLRG